MIVFRLTAAIYQYDLSGKGAEKHGGRWNSKGTPLLYTSGSRALAFAELAMHLPLGIMPKNYVMITLNIPEKLIIEALPANKLPAGWRNNPPGIATQKIGDQFTKAGNWPVLQVPSAIVPGDYNFLINPMHTKMHKIKIVEIIPFAFDSRINNW